jgi:hypothetical protein
MPNSSQSLKDSPLPLRLVSTSTPSSPTARNCETPCTSSPTSPGEPWNSPTTSLGNKLQRLAFLSPRHVDSIEILVDHILVSLAKNGRGLLVVCLSGALRHLIS